MITKNKLYNFLFLLALVFNFNSFSFAEQRLDVKQQLGNLSGQVKGIPSDALAIVAAHDARRDVTYVVYVINGKYRATNVLPGTYKITVKPAVGQLKSFKPISVVRDIASSSSVTANFTVDQVYSALNYVGGMPYDGDSRYPDAKVLPYAEIYPSGPGREIVERTCNACHAVNFLPYNVVRDYSGGRGMKNRDSWIATVDRMHRTAGFGRPGKVPIFDQSLLSAGDREILIDYLANNFSDKSEPRVVKLESVPNLDKNALSKAMFIEYNYREPKSKYDVWPWPHQVDFDKDGNVWLAYTACCIVRFDPRTGESKSFEGHGGGHGIAVDQTDGTVWYSGDTVRRLDPKTGLVDHWKLGNDKALGSNTQIFDSKGNLWMSLLGAGGLAKWDRKTDSIVWWEVPVIRSRPYGIIVDNLDKVWFADYHNGGVTRFDPNTEKFKHFNLVKENAASSIRRLGVDSKNNIWAGTWASINYINKLYRLNPETGEVFEKPFSDLPYAAAYNVEPDTKDNIWVANDNYLSMYSPINDKFTHYPIPVRSDTLKTTITRDDTVWFFYRNAGKHAGYGGTAVALYPDKDKIKTLAAYHSVNNQGYRLAKFSGQSAPPVLGGDRVSPSKARNAESYAIWAKENGLSVVSEKLTVASSSARLVSGNLTELSDPNLIAKGEKIFKTNCSACHSVKNGESNGVGPNLWGISGRVAGTRADFAYSTAMSKSDVIWSKDTILKFIAAPSKYIAGTTMPSQEILDINDQSALIEVLLKNTTGNSNRLDSNQQDQVSQRE